METVEKLVAYQLRNRERTVARISEAMRLIEAEIAAEGFYPHNSGRVTRNEVCRRAGVGASTLKNKTHAQTASDVSCWLKRINPNGKAPKKAADVKAEKISELGKMVDQIAANYDLFKVEFDVLTKRNAELQEENAHLLAQVVRLRSAICKLEANPSVVSIVSSR